MKRNPGAGVVLDTASEESLVSSAGGVLLTRTIGLTGLMRGMSTALARWRRPRARHDPGKVLLDVAVTVALGGDCLADVAALRAQPDVFGPIASDPVVSRLFTTLAADVDTAVTAIRAVRAAARARSWSRARPMPGTGGTRDGGQVIVDIDATLVGAHSEKQGAEPTYKRGFGFHPMCSTIDHGEHGTGETGVLNLRPGRASAFTAADHIQCLDDTLAQLPAGERAQVLVRTDTGGCSKEFLAHITGLGLEYSVGFGVQDPVRAAIEQIPEQAWRAALDGDGQPRDSAQVAELTGWMPSTARAGTSRDWPAGLRVIARRERPHPGAQLRLTDHNGWRVTCFATNTRGPGWTLPLLEVRHRQRARCEDRIRTLKDTGLRNLPFGEYTKNRLWLEVVALAADLLVWTQTLAFEPASPVRRWEPKRLRFRILAVAGRIIRTGRKHLLRLPRGWPWNQHITTGWARLQPA